jgi:hypothetical protein
LQRTFSSYAAIPSHSFKPFRSSAFSTSGTDGSTIFRATAATSFGPGHANGLAVDVAASLYDLADPEAGS